MARWLLALSALADVELGRLLVFRGAKNECVGFSFVSVLHLEVDRASRGKESGETSRVLFLGFSFGCTFEVVVAVAVSVLVVAGSSFGVAVDRVVVMGTRMGLGCRCRAESFFLDGTFLDSDSIRLGCTNCGDCFLH